jgi:hypothetical protein
MHRSVRRTKIRAPDTNIQRYEYSHLISSLQRFARVLLEASSLSLREIGHYETGWASHNSMASHRRCHHPVFTFVHKPSGEWAGVLYSTKGKTMARTVPENLGAAVKSDYLLILLMRYARTHMRYAMEKKL